MPGCRSIIRLSHTLDRFARVGGLYICSHAGVFFLATIPAKFLGNILALLLSSDPFFFFFATFQRYFWIPFQRYFGLAFQQYLWATLWRRCWAAVRRYCWAVLRTTGKELTAAKDIERRHLLQVILSWIANKNTDATKTPKTKNLIKKTRKYDMEHGPKKH